jgi:hypothetical protein
MTLPPLSGECGALQALMNDGSQVTVGSIGDIPAAAIANTAKGILVALALHEGEGWHDLLARLDKTVVQAVVEGRIITEFHL